MTLAYQGQSDIWNIKDRVTLEYQGQSDIWNITDIFRGKHKIKFDLKNLTAFIAYFLNMCVALKRAVC